MRRHNGGYCCQYVQNNFFLYFCKNFFQTILKRKNNCQETQVSVDDECVVIHKNLPLNYNIIDGCQLG